MKQPSSSAGVGGGTKCLPCAPAAKASMDVRLSAAAALGGNVVHGVAALSSELDEYVDENCRSGRWNRSPQCLAVRAYMHVHRGAAGPPVAQGRRLSAVCLRCAALGGSYLKMMNPLAAYNALDEVGYH